MKGKFLLLLGFLFKVAIPARDVPLPPSHCGSRHFCPENGARGRTNVPITVPRLTRATAVETNPTISWPCAWAAADSFGDLAGCLQLRGGGELSEQEELDKARQLLEKAVQGFAAAVRRARRASSSSSSSSSTLQARPLRLPPYSPSNLPCRTPMQSEFDVSYRSPSKGQVVVRHEGHGLGITEPRTRGGQDGGH